MNINEATEKRLAYISEMDSILKTAERQDRDMTEPEQNRFDELEAACDKIDAQFPTAGRAVQPDGPRGNVPGTHNIPQGASVWESSNGKKYIGYKPEHKIADYNGAQLPDGVSASDLSFGRYIRGLITGNWNQAEAERAVMQAAGTTTTNSAGAYLVPDPLSAQYWDLARANAVVFQAGATTIPMDSSTLDVARLSADPTVATKAEGVAFDASDATWERVTLTAHTAGVYSLISNELAQDCMNVQIFEQTLAKALANKIDYYALRGSGSAEPTGIVNYSGVNAVSSVGSPNWLDVLNAMKLNMADNGSKQGSYVISPATWYSLWALLSNSEANNHVGAPPVISENLTEYVTSQIADANAVVGDFTKCVVGMRQGISVEVSTDYKFAENQTAIKATARFDIALSIPNHLCVLSGIS
jgi:HK97 family phage major capsid protein